MSGGKCAQCMASLGDVPIGCGVCNPRYHPTRVCLILHDSVIDAMKEEYGGRGVNFSCTSCRLEVVVMGHNLAVLLMVVEVWLVVFVSRL